MEWSMKMFGSERFQDVARNHTLILPQEPGSAQRSRFMFTNALPISNIGTTDGEGIATTVEAEINGTVDAVSPPRLAGAVSVVPQHAPAPSSSAVGTPSPVGVWGGPALPRRSGADGPGFPARSPILVHPPVLDSREVVMSDQAAAILESSLDVSSQNSHIVAPRQAVISPMTTQTPHLAPALLAPGFSQATTPREAPPLAHNLTAAPHSQIPRAAQTVSVDSSSSTGPAEDARSTYKTRVPGETVGQSRRNSIEGAPDVILTLGGSGYELSKQPDISVQLPTTTSSTSALPTTPTTSLDDLIVPSSQQSLEEVLTIPPETDTVVSKGSGISRFAPRVIPKFNHNWSDFPSWFHNRKRLDAVLDVEAGDLWKKLIGLWLQQERRLAFGLDDKIVS